MWACAAINKNVSDVNIDQKKHVCQKILTVDAELKINLFGQQARLWENTRVACFVELTKSRLTQVYGNFEQHQLRVYQANAKVIFFSNLTKTCFDQTQKPSAEESHFSFLFFLYGTLFR